MKKNQEKCRERERDEHSRMQFQKCIKLHCSRWLSIAFFLEVRWTFAANQEYLTISLDTLHIFSNWSVLPPGSGPP